MARRQNAQKIQMRFRKSEGLTASEALLAELCSRSFLQLWTYPNLFKKPGKELIDLMVVFGNDILLFSDKSCAFPQLGIRLSTGSAGSRAPLASGSSDPSGRALASEISRTHLSRWQSKRTIADHIAQPR